jgi:flagellar biosynthesis/type III secretory pathway protein FliH
MRGVVKLILTASLALGLTGVALGQRQGPGLFNGPGRLIADPGVQKELKMTNVQLGKIRVALARVMQDHRDDLAKIRGDTTLVERMQIMRVVGEDSRKAIGGILNAKQMKRFKQILWQEGGFRAMQDPEVQKELMITEEQREKLREIGQGAMKQLQEVFQGGNAQGAQEQLEKIRKEAQEKAEALLTDEQKKTWKEMKGEPFALQRPGR